jgi:hypothetical protein
MSLTHESTTVEAWLEWFATEKQAAYRAYLCTRYHLDALDAEALINDAQLQVFLHWATLENPLASLWQTLKHAVIQQGQRRSRERQQLAAFARQHRLHAHSAARTAQHVADVLTLVSPRQRHILAMCTAAISCAALCRAGTTGRPCRPPTGQNPRGHEQSRNALTARASDRPGHERHRQGVYSLLLWRGCNRYSYALQGPGPSVCVGTRHLWGWGKGTQN